MCIRDRNESRRFYDPLSQQSGNLNRFSLDNLVSGTLYLGHSNSLNWDMNATLSYNKALDSHMVNALVGISMQENQSKSDNATYVGFPSGALSAPELSLIHI